MQGVWVMPVNYMSMCMYSVSLMPLTCKPMPDPSTSHRPPKLLDRVRYVCRRLHYSIHTEKAYVRWVKRYVLFHDTRHPEMLVA